MAKIEIHPIGKNNTVDVDRRGMIIALKGRRTEKTALAHIQTCLTSEEFDFFSWQVGFNGLTCTVTGTLKKLIPTPTFLAIRSAFSSDPNVLSCHEMVLSKAPATRQPGRGVDRPANDPWYWPLSKRLPPSSYSNPEPIKIAQADTGITLHPTLISGFQPGESMSFYYPEGSRTGKGVICWDDNHPFFISHGSSTSGLMIGQPSGSLRIHGMTPKGVVELVPCRVTDSVLLVPDDVERLAECINWAIDEGIKVVNVSLGTVAFHGDPALSKLTLAMERAFKCGVIVCCASGQYAPAMIYPAVYAILGWCICCAPSNEKNKPASQSIWPAFQFGYVTIAAPGENMPQAGWQDGICSSQAPIIGKSEGSSYSTAYVSSLAALWWAYNYEALSRLNKREIVPLFRHTLELACTPWNGNYPKNYGKGIVDPNKVLKSLEALRDYSVDSSGIGKIKKANGGTYRNVTLYAHGSGSIHVLESIFVEGKLTLISSSSATISMSGTVVCRELEIICKNSAKIEADDLEYYDSCSIQISVASTCNVHIAAEGPMTGAVSGKNLITGSTLIASVYWRCGRKELNVTKDKWSTRMIANDWSGKWA